MGKKFKTDEERKEARRIAVKKYNDKKKEDKKLLYQKNKGKYKEKNKKYYEENKEKIKENVSNYNKNNKEKIKENKKVYYENNKEEIQEKQRQQRLKNKDKKKEYDKKYREIANKRRNERRKNDINYKIICSIRTILWRSFNNNGYNKKSRSFEILGCSYDDFVSYLESNFEKWMTWENKGLYNGKFNYGWDIDHIIPISTAKTEEDIIRLNHYTNLQPLCSKVNRDIKKNKKSH